MLTTTEIHGDTATVRVIPPGSHERLAALLLEAAGEDRKREVRLVSTGGRGFRVPLDIYEAFNARRMQGLVRAVFTHEEQAEDANDSEIPDGSNDPENPESSEQTEEQTEQAAEAEQPAEVAEPEPAEPEQAEEPAAEEKPARKPRTKAAKAEDAS